MVSTEIIKDLFDRLNDKNDYNKEYSKIYKLHKYWARKPWYIIEKYISRYSNSGDLVLDPFCGSGATGLEAILAGRDFIGYDLNPMATMISSESMNLDFDVNEIEKEFQDIESKCAEEIQELYLTNEHCPACGANLQYKFISCGPKFSNEYSGKLFCIKCNSRSANKVKTLDDYDYKKIDEIEKIDLRYWIPEIEFPKKFYKDRFSYKGISKVSDMFTKRNLIALSKLLDVIKRGHYKNHDLIMLAFTNTVLHASKLKGENVRPLGVNNYWVPDDYIEENVWYRFADRANQTIVSKRVLKKRAEKINQIGEASVVLKSALASGEINSVDYIFTDPPYGDAIQYSELSFVWNAWIKKEYDTSEEIIINPVQNKNYKTFNEMLNVALTRIYDQLKPNKYFTLCFQNKDFNIWENVITRCKDLGFSLVDVEIYDTYGSPFNKHWAKFSPKADIYVTFIKGEYNNGVSIIDCNASVSEIVSEICTYMKRNELSVDLSKIYDITVSYIIWALYSCNETSISNFSVKTVLTEIEKYV